MIDESLYQISKLLDLTQSQLYFLEVKTWMPVQDPFSQKMITFFANPSHPSMFKAGDQYIL